MFDYSIQREKHEQAKEILTELNIDMWLVLGRETSLNNDPVLPLVSGIDYFGLSALIFTKKESIALVTKTDSEGVLDTELFDKVIGYERSFSEAFTKILNDLSPNNIAINYSKYNVAADGLSHGLYLLITEILEEHQFKGSLISADQLISKLRGCKSLTEKKRLERSISITGTIFDEAKDFIKVGQSEKDIYHFFHERIKHYQVEPSWETAICPGVFVGGDTIKGHNGPSDIIVKKGDVVDIDFGIMKDSYCSDLQRIYYILDDHEETAHEEVQRAFDTVKETIQKVAKYITPGVTGAEVDNVARQYIVSKGYPEWDHGLGHEVGQSAHDGGIVLGPEGWGRYTDREINTPIEKGMVFAVEPSIRTSRGYITIEEMLYVTDHGTEFLSSPQKEIFLI